MLDIRPIVVNEEMIVLGWKYEIESLSRSWTKRNSCNYKQDDIISGINRENL